MPETEPFTLTPDQIDKLPVTKEIFDLGERGKYSFLVKRVERSKDNSPIVYVTPGSGERVGESLPQKTSKVK